MVYSLPHFKRTAGLHHGLMKGAASLLAIGGVAFSSVHWIGTPTDEGLIFALGWCAVSVGSLGFLLLRQHARAIQVLVWGSWAVLAASPTLYGDHWLANLSAFPLQVLLAGLALGRRATYSVACACALSALCLLANKSAADLNPSFSHWPHAFVLGGLAVFLGGLRFWWGDWLGMNADHLEGAKGTRGTVVEHPGRLSLIRAIEDRLVAGAEQQRHVLLQVNLDRFRHVNLANGVDVGDRVLEVYTKRLESILPLGGALRRLGVDEFALVWPIAKDAEAEIHAVVSLIQAELHRPVDLVGHPGPAIALSASLGLTLFPSSKQDTAKDILLRAGTALDAIKETGGSGAQIFDQELGQRMIKRFRIESSLRRAIREGELRVYLQSQVDSRGEVVGAECLVRWQHPQEGMVLPGEFLPIAEESDLIVEIGEWVIERACELQVKMQEAGLSQRLAINISPRQFFKPNFMSHLQSAVERTGAAPQKLVLEITEGLVIRDTEDVITKMNHLIQNGFSFSLDDFGTGYSSLSHLKNLPVQELKIARNFIQDAPSNLADAAIVKAICSIAGFLNMKVVAEGVETSLHASFIDSLGDIIYQGFLYSRPLPAEEWLEGQLVLKVMQQTLSELKGRHAYG